MKLTSLLESLSLREINRLLKAKVVHARRQAAATRVESLEEQLAAARANLAKLDATIDRALRNGRTSPPRRRSLISPSPKSAHPRSKSANPRKGSLRSYLAAALKAGAAGATELAKRVLKAGYKTESNAETFAHAVRNALYANREFARLGRGRFALAR